MSCLRDSFIVIPLSEEADSEPDNLNGEVKFGKAAREAKTFSVLSAVLRQINQEGNSAFPKKVLSTAITQRA